MSDLISAEVEPKAGKASAAARVLQERGLKVLHVGTTLSVQGPLEAWKEHFGAELISETKQTVRGVEGSGVTYWRTESGEIPVPEEIADEVTAIYLVQPPDFL